MSNSRIVARNMIWNWAGTGASMVAGLVIMPFLVQHLGEGGYGLWILIASLTGYFDLLDLGLRGSLGRNIAFFRAKDDPIGVQSIVSTGTALLCGGAVLVLAGTAAIIPLFFHLFEVPASEYASVRLALLLIGVNLAVIFPVSVFDATLWAYQRFDLLNLIEIPAMLLRIGLTVVLIGAGHGLATLAVITLCVTLAGGTAKAICCFRLDPSIRFGLGSITLEATRCLFGFGVWCFVLSVTRVIAAQLGPLIVGSRIGVALVTPFAIASRLLAYVSAILVATTGVLTPVATALHAEARQDSQRSLFLEGGKWCMTLALFFLGLFTFLGQPLVELWMRRDIAHASQMLLILSLGEVLPLSQSLTANIVLGMGKHRLAALMGIAETVISLGLASVLIAPCGLVGVCFAIAVPAAACRGIVQIVYACRVLEVPVWRYMVTALGPALAAAAPALVLLAGLMRWHGANTWLASVGFAAIYGLCFAISSALILVGLERVRTVVRISFLPWAGTRPAVSDFRD